jgi:signal transduction histidine kinase
LIVGEFNQLGGTRVRFDIDGETQRLSSDAELALFRITQESLNNIRKHSQATQATVQLKYFQNKVRLKIADNGKGFDISQENLFAVRRGSLGLVSMKERASLLGLFENILSPKAGTAVTVELNY